MFLAQNRAKYVSAFRYNVCMIEIIPEIEIISEPENRTEEENKQTINRLLYLYDLMLLEYCKLIQNIGQDDDAESDEDDDKKDKDKKDKPKKSDYLTEFKAFATLADILMKRWNIVHRGYDTNAYIAAANAKAKQQTGESLPDEEREGETVNFHPDMKSAVDNLSKLGTDEPEQTGPEQLAFNFTRQNGERWYA